MKIPQVATLIFSSIFLLSAMPASARDSARDLRRMVGYTIVAAATIQETKEGDIGETIVTLNSGISFKMTDSILTPLACTDVIVFAKKPSVEIIAMYGDKLPIEKLMSYRILIDNEAHDATRVR